MIIIKIITLIILLFIIKYIIDKRQEILNNKKEKLVSRNKVKRILKHKNLLDIIYSIEGYYYYNQEAYIELLKHIENFLEIIDLCYIDPHYSTNLYYNLLDLKKLILNCLLSFELKLPIEYNVNDVILDLTEILDEYLKDIYILHEKYIKENGMDYTIKLIFQNYPDGYNIDDNLLEKGKKLYFNRI